ncbi:MAG: hypothetical protein WHS88_07680 [Anaerohalosphaeraceae bacterium]
MEQMAGANLEYADQTTLHPLGLIAVLCLGVCVLFVPRRWSVVPFLLIACFISTAQRLVLFGADLTLLRILVLFGFLRVLIRNEYQPFTWNLLDTLVTAWLLSQTAIYTLQIGTTSALMNRLGFAFESLGCYFYFRTQIRDWKDVSSAITGCIWISVLVAVFFMIEWSTGRNLFAFFGGVPEITAVREGRLRCQGAFSHPILAGCFWVSLLPLMACHWWKSPSDRRLAAVGVVCCLLIVAACSSSTPVAGIFFALLGGGLFALRRHLSLIRWGVVVLLVVLHFVREKPVWHLVSRVNIVGGSTGWHRYHLMDAAIRHFGEWALLGTPSTAHWGYGLNDVTNQYILEGVRGGLLSLLLFIGVLTAAFVKAGRLQRSVKTDRYRLYLFWALGVSLFVHCMNFIAVSYFGQIYVIFFLLLGMISSLSPVFSPRAVMNNFGKSKMVPPMQEDIHRVPSGLVPVSDRPSCKGEFGADKTID